MKSLVLLTLVLVSLSLPGDKAPEQTTPRSTDPRLEVILFAQQPDIVHPVALTFDARGKMLVVESHTHFRPAGYSGPKHDRVRMLEDTDRDGRADRFTTFFEGTQSTMDIALHPDGSIYLATRNEILRLRDTRGTGVADQKERIVFLETTGNYPHNGLSGLAFDKQGNLLFGMGENLGVPYKIIGMDDVTISGGGEGGNIFWCTATGEKLRRFATGFWNPFGVNVDSLGRVLAVDNDPDSMPPCRLLHVVEGGDFGYQFRYGRSGRHPFQAWNGQLPGTLPMVAGTGESPCEVLRYESQGLPAEYFGKYLVPVWADHRLEMYDLKPRGASFAAEQKILVQGDQNFRPTGLAVAPDGSLFLADWVLPDYNLHGKGAIWKVRPRQFNPFPAPMDQLKKNDRKANTSNPAALQVQNISNLNHVDDGKKLLCLASGDDPYLQHAARMQLARHPKMLDAIKTEGLKPEERMALLLSQRATGDARYQQFLPGYLQDEHEEVRFLAAKWIADEALGKYRPQIEEALRSSALSVRMMLANSTALARINGEEVSETKLADRFVVRLKEAGLADAMKLQLLRLVPPAHPQLTIPLLSKLLDSPHEPLRQCVVLTLCLHPKAERLAVLQQIAASDKYSADLRALAQIGTLEQRPLPAQASANSKRPAVENPAAWLAQFGQGHVEAGRRVFYHPQKAGCYRCHQVDGRGNEIGPDLSTIGRTEPLRILESLLHPSATVAPAYQNWTLVMHDGRVLNGMLVRTYLDEYTYLDAQGVAFKVKTHDVAETIASPTSIMPEGLLNHLSDQEVRDLLAFLFSRK